MFGSDMNGVVQGTDAEAMTMKTLATVMLTVLVGALAGVVFIYSGAV